MAHAHSLFPSTANDQVCFFSMFWRQIVEKVVVVLLLAQTGSEQIYELITDVDETLKPQEPFKLLRKQLQ